MLSFLRSRRKEQPPATGESAEFAAAPGTSIRFNPHLIEQLTADHRDLLNTYIAVMAAAKAADTKGVTSGLEQMQTQLRAHLLTEKVRLYVYLDHMLKDDAATRTRVRELRREMDRIARQAMAFFLRYAGIGEGDQSLEGFIAEFEAMGVVLNERIEREEATLYTLYMPS